MKIAKRKQRKPSPPKQRLVAGSPAFSPAAQKWLNNSARVARARKWLNTFSKPNAVAPITTQTIMRSNSGERLRIIRTTEECFQTIRINDQVLVQMQIVSTHFEVGTWTQRWRSRRRHRQERTQGSRA